MKILKSNPAGEGKPFKLPAPVFEPSCSVFEALRMRKTTRIISKDKITLQLLADILWAAAGINRKKGPFNGLGRTAASASNAQEISVYVALEEGTFLYDSKRHRLIPVLNADIRNMAIGGTQSPAGADAPVRLIYVVDIDKFKEADYQEPGLFDVDVQKSYYYVDTGLMAQNVSLAASSLGLAAWFHNCNKEALRRELRLKPNQRALFGQTIGYSDD